MVGYTPIYTNNKIIAKPPVKASKESLGSALDSFYNDIARIEKTETERTAQQQDSVVAVTEQAPVPIEDTKPETEPETVPSDTTMKERKKKKVSIYISRYLSLLSILYSLFRHKNSMEYTKVIKLLTRFNFLCYVELNMVIFGTNF